MKGLRYAILPHGRIESDYGWLVSMPNPARASNKCPEAIWVAAPSFSVLIDHPKEGYILYDTGTYPGDESYRRSSKALEEFPLIIKRSEFLDERLHKLELSVEDINIVVVSHMHWDHSNGLKFFENRSHPIKALVPKEDYLYGFTQTHCSSTVPDDCIYSKETYDLGNIDFKMIEKDHNLYEGVEIISLGGHTPSILGMILHLESGTIIFTSDAVYGKVNYGPPTRVPAILYDSLGYHAAIEKLRKLEKRYEATMIFSHDMDQIKDLKTTPFFYE